MPAYDEKSCLIQLKAGSQAAFAQIFHQYKNPVYQATLKIVPYEEIAEDILQTTFIRLWEKKSLIDPEQPFKAYLYRIASNLVADYFRRAAADKRLQARLMIAATELYDHIEETIGRKESEAVLKEAISRLPPKRREVYTLIKVDGLSYEEVSRQLGISVTTINDHMVRASKFVREYFIQSYHTSLLLVFITLLNRQ